jgi:hypothetical protein
MIHEVSRLDFLVAPDTFERGPCLALAAVAGDTQVESTVLEGWSSLCALLSGTGTRVGFRAFVALVQDSEVAARSALAAFSERSNDKAAWRFVAAPVYSSSNPLEVLKEVEWRAHKGNPGHGVSALSVIEVDSAV